MHTSFFSVFFLSSKEIEVGTSGWYGVLEALSNWVVDFCWNDLGGERDNKLSTLRILNDEPPEADPDGFGAPWGTRLEAKLPVGDTTKLLELVLLLLLLLLLLPLIERDFLE